MRDVLKRPLYRAVIEWDRFRRNGERKQLKRDENAHPMRIEAAHLRIVPEDVAAAVDAQRCDRRERYLRKTDGKLLGRPAPHAVKHLLSGLLRCGCGATFEAQTAAYGRRKGGVYLCSAARRKGRHVCSSTLHLPIADTEAHVLDAIEQTLLDAGVFADVLDVAVARLDQDRPTASQLTAERERLQRETMNLVSALAVGGDVPSLLAEIQTRDARIAALDRALSGPAVLDRAGLRRALDAKLQDWRRLLRSRPTHGQTVIRQLLDGPIQVGMASGAEVSWTASASVTRVLGTLSPKLASPAGFEPALPA